MQSLPVTIASRPHMQQSRKVLAVPAAADIP